MIDVENIVFSTVAKRLRSDFPGIFVTGEPTADIQKFPAVTFEEMDNSTYFKTIDNSGEENHATVMYQADVYSNLSFGKKAQCKEMIAAIDDEMRKMGFVRMGKNPVNMSDATKYRIVSRYRGIVGKDNYVYKR